MKLNSFKPTLQKYKLLIALALGIGFGFFLKEFQIIFDTSLFGIIKSLIGFPGWLFLSLLQMIMVPIVVSSLAIGISKWQGKKGFYSLSVRLIPYFLLTTSFAVILGVLLFFLFLNDSPKGDILSLPKAQSGISLEWSELFPKNPIASMARGQMFAIVLFGIFLGLYLLQSKTDSDKSFRSLLESLDSFSHWIVSIAMTFSPLAIFSLVAVTVAGATSEILGFLMKYFMTVALGLFLLLIFYLFLAWFFCNKMPIWFLQKAKVPILLAFTSSSSSATLPVSIITAKEEMHIKEEVADFVLPIGATINMDGTALYQCVAILFLSHFYGMQFEGFDLMLLCAIVTLASIGTAATPGAGLVILGGILSSFGIPSEAIGLILGVDRILDMLRTSINVSGDLTATLIADKWWSEK